MPKKNNAHKRANTLCRKGAALFALLLSLNAIMLENHLKKVFANRHSFFEKQWYNEISTYTVFDKNNNELLLPKFLKGELPMYQIANLTNNPNVKIVHQMGPFTVIEHQKDLSIQPGSAMAAYYCAEMNVKKRQVLCDLSKAQVTVQAGAMQWMVGDVNATTGIKGVGDLLGKAMRGKVSGESTIKPEYTGSGMMMLEPTYKHLILMDAAEWGGAVVLDDGLFLACDSRLKHKAVMRSSFSSAVAGGEGLFNLSLNGAGVFCIEADCPREELIEVTLENDVLKIDGNYAVAWSAGLAFTVERSGKSLLGSAASGEGLVNVYRGTGKVLMMPVGMDTV